MHWDSSSSSSIVNDNIKILMALSYSRKKVVPRVHHVTVLVWHVDSVYGWAHWINSQGCARSRNVNLVCLRLESTYKY